MKPSTGRPLHFGAWGLCALGAVMDSAVAAEPVNYRQELRTLIETWESPDNAKRCTWTKDRQPVPRWRDFPTKDCGNVKYWKDLEFEVAACKPLDEADHCDDADSVFFSGLLCMSGDEYGCESVRLSQDSSQHSKGRWWRSPRQKVLKPSDPPNFPQTFDEAALHYVKTGVQMHLEATFSGKDSPDSGDISDRAFSPGSTSFSADAANGVYAYLVMKKEDPRAREAFANWVKYIEKLPKCESFCGIQGRGTPLFCPSDRCHFTTADCAMFLLLGNEFKVDVSFCHTPLVQFVSRETYEAQLTGLRKQKDGLLEELSKRLPAPAAKKFRNDVNTMFNKLADRGSKAASKVDKAYSTMEAPFRNALAVQNELLWISANTSGDFHAIHNIVMTTLLLEKLSLSDKKLHDQAVGIAKDNPKNAFLAYAANRPRGNIDAVAKLIVDNCPKGSEEHPRTEWKWEREPGEAAWQKNYSMYWECIHVAKLALNNPIPANYDSTSDLQDIAASLLAVQEVIRRLTAFGLALAQMSKLYDSPALLTKPLDDLRNEAVRLGSRQFASRLNAISTGNGWRPRSVPGRGRSSGGGNRGGRDVDDFLRPRPGGTVPRI